jgi:hypothetical protein
MARARGLVYASSGALFDEHRAARLHASLAAPSRTSALSATLPSTDAS